MYIYIYSLPYSLRKFLYLFLSPLCTAPLNYFQIISSSGGTLTGGIYCSTFTDSTVLVSSIV